MPWLLLLQALVYCSVTSTTHPFFCFWLHFSVEVFSQQSSCCCIVSGEFLNLQLFCASNFQATPYITIFTSKSLHLFPVLFLGWYVFEGHTLSTIINLLSLTSRF
uniref:Uncharacterized protein n=1 Tax=Sphaerodactylus townsendi TaxID=933632 RepID=A0ACB8GBM2_9SAUR